jgi:hypothetical protein
VADRLERAECGGGGSGRRVKQARGRWWKKWIVRSARSNNASSSRQSQSPSEELAGYNNIGRGVLIDCQAEMGNG